MGASVPVEFRSDRTITSAPSAMAALTRSRTSSMAWCRAGPPPATSKSPSMAKARKPGVLPSSLT